MHINTLTYIKQVQLNEDIAAFCRTKTFKGNFDDFAHEITINLHPSETI